VTAFRFKFEGVLRARREAERSAQRAVAEHRRNVEAALATVRGHQGAIDRAAGARRSALVGAVDLDAVRVDTAEAAHHRRAAAHVVQQLSDAYDALQAAQVDLRAAVAGRRAIELLREQRRQAWADAERHREQAAHDDGTAARAAVQNRRSA
jgi:flagellar biosynthesis chaperone FliJ